MCNVFDYSVCRMGEYEIFHQVAQYCGQIFFPQAISFSKCNISCCVVRRQHLWLLREGEVGGVENCEFIFLWYPLPRFHILQTILWRESNNLLACSLFHDAMFLFPCSPLVDCSLLPPCQTVPSFPLARLFSAVGWGTVWSHFLTEVVFVSPLLQFHSICLSPLLLESVSGYLLVVHFAWGEPGNEATYPVQLVYSILYKVTT